MIPNRSASRRRRNPAPTKPREITCWNCGHVHRAAICHLCKKPAKRPKGSRIDQRARTLRLLGPYLKNPAARNPVKPDVALGTVASVEEMERVQALLEDGFTVLLTPLADQVVIAVVDLDKLMALIGDPRASLH